MNEKKVDSEMISLAGEFYVVAQLFQRGFVATPTLGKTKHVDILVYHPETGRRVIIEVKTTQEETAKKKSKLFGENYEWIMHEKHENIVDPNLFYCFVLLRRVNELPRFFIVPSKEVAEYVKEEHKRYLRHREDKAREAMKKKGTNKISYKGKELTLEEYIKRVDEECKGMRKFRISTKEKSKYEDNWNALLKT
ncbi:MAG: hypothetical protein B7O98_01865 [Zestosphaera tikiterensis]|uniref:Uncharacterized protein n=1 Tax=Zestosphaera tikiterensis TaxID=1973259 RepID=A0A2R7Y6U3_9CREN|nr:MAG: hypothetical protein B7O98_01865 [Zestosphaera tikiterensis]